MKRASRLAVYEEKEDKLLDSNGEFDIKQFLPSATELIGMTPSEKQAIIAEINNLAKKADA